MPDQPDPLAQGFPPGQLFTGPHPQPGMSRPHVIPGVAHVFVTADGDYIVNERRPSFGQAFAAKRRYDVDATDKNSSLKGGNLPSSQNNFYFPYEISLAWRVHDPVAIVRRGIREADTVIEQCLSTPLREITTKVAPRDWALAEAQLNQRFGTGIVLDGGITVIRFAAKLTIDPGLAAHLSEESTLRGQQALDAMRRKEVEDALSRGDFGLLVEHLTKGSDETREVINLVLQSRQISEKDRQEMRRLLIEQGVAQDVDLERYLDWVLPPSPGPAQIPAGTGTSPLAISGVGVPPVAPSISPTATGNATRPGRSAPPVGPPQPVPGNQYAPTPPPVPAPPPASDASGIIAWDDVEDAP
jgi:hypothetical protein